MLIGNAIVNENGAGPYRCGRFVVEREYDIVKVGEVLDRADDIQDLEEGDWFVYDDLMDQWQGCRIIGTIHPPSEETWGDGYHEIRSTIFEGYR